MQQPENIRPSVVKEMEKALSENVHERKALEVALREEQALANRLRQTASHVINPAVREIFEQMAVETEKHYAIIESEYAHMMGMVHETDIDTYVRE